MPKIIYLNGPTSSGKTTLAKALQEKLSEPFLHIGIDRLIGFMPDKLNNWEGGSAPEGFSWKKATDLSGHPTSEIVAGPFAQRISATLIDFAFLLASQNYNLIIDDVALGAIQVERWKKALQKFDVLYVSVVTSLEILEKREKERGDRMVGSARDQY